MVYTVQIHVAVFSSCNFVGGLNVYIMHCFYLYTLVQYNKMSWRRAVADSIDFIYSSLVHVLYSVQWKRLAVSEGGGLSVGGLTGDYYFNNLTCDILGLLS